jgi:uroporphyrinogen-III synthase
MPENLKANLRGLRVVCFESRRAKEIAELIRRYGGETVSAPSMREVPLGENRAALDLLPELEAGKFDLLILTTGVGTRALNQVLLSRYSQKRIVSALEKTRLVARGPKPIAALKELGLAAAVTVPEPNTWREVLAALDAAGSVRGKRIAIQEYGIANPELVAGLEKRGATVEAIPVYRWALPEDLAPLREAIEKLGRGEVEVALFTNGAQVDHLFRVAAKDHVEERLRVAFKKVAIASIGPVCSEALERFGLRPDIEPAHPKMGALIAEVAARASEVLAVRRSV